MGQKKQKVKKIFPDIPDASFSRLYNVPTNVKVYFNLRMATCKSTVQDKLDTLTSSFRTAFAAHEQKYKTDFNAHKQFTKKCFDINSNLEGTVAEWVSELKSMK